MTIAQQKDLSPESRFIKDGDQWYAVVRFPDSTPTVYTPLGTSEQVKAWETDAVNRWKKSARRIDERP